MPHMKILSWHNNNDCEMCNFEFKVNNQFYNVVWLKKRDCLRMREKYNVMAGMTPVATVKPAKRDHSGNGAFGLCREVGLF